MNKQQKSAVENILSNDEVSSDEELRNLFIDEIKLSEKEADKMIARRMDYLNSLPEVRP